MNEVVAFLCTVYHNSVFDIAAIRVAEADGNKNEILEYLLCVKNYAEKLIDKVKEL